MRLRDVSRRTWVGLLVAVAAIGVLVDASWPPSLLGTGGRVNPTAPIAFVGARVFDGERFVGPLTVIVNGGLVVTAAADAAVPHGVTVIDAREKTLLPGFIDAHVHLGFFNPHDVVRGGITSARDLAWPLERIRALAHRLAPAAADGPALTFAGPMLTAPGGYPTRAAWAPPETGREVASPEAAREAVRALAAAGVSVIKIAQEPSAGPTLGIDTLRAIVEEAHAAHLRVTSHCGSLAELKRALDAGVDELAHGLWDDERIDDETIARMVRVGITVIPTLHIDPSLQRIDNVARFARAGGRVIYGTDMGNPPVPPGIDVEELRLMMRAGMTLEKTLASATSASASYLGLDAHGIIAPGARADLILVRGDLARNDRAPDLDPLAHPEMVLRAGHVVR